MKFDLSKNYYAIIGVSSDASEAEINEKIDAYIDEITSNANYSTEYILEATKVIIEVKRVLLDPSVRAEYDEAKGFSNKSVKVQEVEELNDNELEEKGLGIAAKVTIATLAVAILTASGVIYGGTLANKERKNENDNIATNTISNEVNATTYMSSTPVSAATASTSIDSIQDTANNVWNKVQDIQETDKDYAKDVSENDIISLVRWAKHEGTVISNADAFGLLYELAENKDMDIADVTNGLDISEGLHEYTQAFKNVSDNGTLVDETTCLNDISNMKSDLDINSIVDANIITAEMYAHTSNSSEFSLATNYIEKTSNGAEFKDKNFKKLYNTISADDFNKNYAIYSQFMDSLNTTLDKSDSEDKLVLSK